MKVSINDFIVKAVSKANLDVPQTNSQIVGNKIREFKNVDISIAVQIDSGLITPIIFNANQKSIGQISKETKELVEKAKNGKLMSE